MCYRASALKKLRFVRELEGAISFTLADKCFCLDRPPSTWIRRFGWKADMIDLHVKWELIINYYVWLPHGPIPGYEDMTFGYFAFCGIGKIGGSRDSAIPFPRPMWSRPRGVRRIVAQVIDALKWFEQLDTPSKCLAYLRSSGFPTAGSPSYVSCERYLQSLPPMNNPACTIGQFLTVPSDGFRRLFVTPPRG